MYRVFTRYRIYTMYKVFTIYRVYTMYKVYTICKLYIIYTARWSSISIQFISIRSRSYFLKCSKKLKCMKLHTAVCTMHTVYAMYKVYSILGYISCMRYIKCLSYVIFKMKIQLKLVYFIFMEFVEKNYFMSRFIHIRLILEMFCGFTSFMWGILEVPKETLCIFPYFQIKIENIKM